MSADCPYLIDGSTNRLKKGKCKLDDDICPYVRYCPNKRKVVNSDNYKKYGCGKQQIHLKEVNGNGKNED